MLIISMTELFSQFKSVLRKPKPIKEGCVRLLVKIVHFTCSLASLRRLVNIRLDNSTGVELKKKKKKRDSFLFHFILRLL